MFICDEYCMLLNAFNESTDNLKDLADLMDHFDRVEKEIKMKVIKDKDYPVYQFNYIEPMLGFNKKLPYLRRTY